MVIFGKMNKAELQKNKEEAFKEYLRGNSKHSIGKKLKIRKATIVNWAKKGDWDRKLKEANQQAEQEAYWDINKEKATTLRLIRATEALFAKELTTAIEIPKSSSSFAQLQKVKWELLIPKNVTQFNLTKQNSLSINLELDKLLKATRDGTGI